MLANPAVPDGFRVVQIKGDFLEFNGPLYGKCLPDKVVIAFRVEQRHTNPLGICHGGMLATFADMLVPCANMYRPGAERRFLPTISLQLDYLGAAKLGAWVEGEAQVLRVTRNMLFGHGLITADGVLAVRFSGVFKLGPPFGDASDPDPLRLRA